MSDISVENLGCNYVVEPTVPPSGDVIVRPRTDGPVAGGTAFLTVPGTPVNLLTKKWLVRVNAAELDSRRYELEGLSHPWRQTVVRPWEIIGVIDRPSLMGDIYPSCIWGPLMQYESTALEWPADAFQGPEPVRQDAAAPTPDRLIVVEYGNGTTRLIELDGGDEWDVTESELIVVSERQRQTTHVPLANVLLYHVTVRG